MIYTGFLVGKKAFRGFSYNASVEYRPATGSLLYGGYRRGHKRGGFNAKGTGLTRFGPEKVDDYYLCLKQDVRIGDVRSHFERPWRCRRGRTSAGVSTSSATR